MKFPPLIVAAGTPKWDCENDGLQQTGHIYADDKVGIANMPFSPNWFTIVSC